MIWIVSSWIEQEQTLPRYQIIVVPFSSTCGYFCIFLIILSSNSSIFFRLGFLCHSGCNKISVFKWLLPQPASGQEGKSTIVCPWGPKLFSANIMWNRKATLGKIKTVLYETLTCEQQGFQKDLENCIRGGRMAQAMTEVPRLIVSTHKVEDKTDTYKLSFVLSKHAYNPCNHILINELM